MRILLVNITLTFMHMEREQDKKADPVRFNLRRLKQRKLKFINHVPTTLERLEERPIRITRAQSCVGMDKPI